MGAGGSNVLQQAMHCANVAGDRVEGARSSTVEYVDHGGCLWAPTLLVGRAGQGTDHDLERMMQVLFRLHDLNKNGVLEEEELIQLNKKTAKLHHGKDVQTDDISAKYTNIFRSGLDPEGKPVPYATFRKYMLGVLDGWDSDICAQKMIIEQLCAEAALARAAFHSPSLESVSDAPFLPTISFDEGVLAFGGSVPAVPRKQKCLEVEDFRENYGVQYLQETVDLDAIAEASSTSAWSTTASVVSRGSNCSDKSSSANIGDALKGAYMSLRTSSESCASPAIMPDAPTTHEAVAPKGPWPRLKNSKGNAPCCC